MTGVTTTGELRPGSIERNYCRVEHTTTTWRWAGVQNHTSPRSDYWICVGEARRGCDYLRIALADLPDAQGFAKTFLDRRLAAAGMTVFEDVRSGEYEELLQDAFLRLMKLYTEWDPDHGLRFTSYASQWLPVRLNEWWREQNGRDGNKPLSSAVSLDADQGERGPLGESVGSWAGDPSMGGGASLARALVRRRRGDADAGARPGSARRGGAGNARPEPGRPGDGENGRRLDERPTRRDQEVGV